MALILSNEELNKITDAVYAKVKADSTAMDELPVVQVDEDGNLIGDVTSLPALRNTELADGTTLKDVVVVPFDYLVLKADLAALRATEAAEIAEETNAAVHALITDNGVEAAVETINNATQLLNNATTLFNNSVAGLNLKASTARFKGVVTNTDGVYADTLAPERITLFDVYYNTDTKKFYVKDPDSLSYWSDWSDASFALYLEKVTDLNTMTESISIWKDKIYICEDSLYVWSTEEDNLTEISGTGSGAGAGFFNVTNLFPISGFYTLESAVLEVWDNKDTQKLVDSDLVGMTITYLDESKGWVDYRNTLTLESLYPVTNEDETTTTFEDRFLNVNNWVRHDATNAVRIILLDGVNLTKNADGTVNITKEAVTSLVDVDSQVTENSEKPVMSGAVNAALQSLRARVESVPNALVLTTNEAGEDYLYLAYVDPANPNGGEEIISIPDPEGLGDITFGVPFSGGGEGGSATSNKLKGNLFTQDKYGELTKILNVESIDRDLTLYFNADLLDEETDITITDVTFRIGDAVIYQIKNPNESDFSLVSGSYKDVTIDKRYITGNITMYITYTYYDVDKGKDVTKVNKSGVLSINVMNINLRLTTPNHSAVYTSTPTKTLQYNVVTTGVPRTACTMRCILNGERKSLGNVEASLGNFTRDFVLSPGRNEIFVYVECDYAGEHIESNGIYTEVYYESAEASVGGADILLCNLNYAEAKTFYSANEDNQHPTFYTTTYNQVNALNFAVYKARVLTVPVSVKYVTIDGLGNKTTTNYSDTNIDTIQYNSQNDIVVFNNFFRQSYEKGICNIVVAIEDNSNTNRTIPCVVSLGQFDFDLPTNIAFDLKASSKSNTNINPASWTYGGVTTTFHNFSWNAFTGWVGNSLLLNTNAHVSINASAGAINNYTFAIKYKTSRTSDDELVFLKFANLQLSPTQIILGDRSRLLVAADTEVDLIVSCDGQRTYIYLNGILSSILNEVFLLDSNPIEIGAFRKNSAGVILSNYDLEETGTYIDNLKCTLNIYSVSLYKAFVSDNSALGILSLNQTTQAATNAVINNNNVFDTKISISNMQDYYGVGNNELVAELDTYIEPPRSPFLLSEQDLYNLPKGLRVIIIEGPYLGSNGEYDVDANQYIPEGTVIGDTVSPGVDKNKELDVIDSLNSFNKSNKSLRIAASRVVSYIAGETEDMSGNFAAYRPVISCLGTSSMNYAIKNYRLYLNKKTKVKYINDTRTSASLGDSSTTVKADKVFSNYNPFTKKGIMGNFDSAEVNKSKAFAMRSNSIPVSTFCIKEDYADSSGAQNTGGAILTNKCVNAISKTPAQNTSYGSRKDVRTSVDGQAALLFSYKWDGWTDETGQHHPDKQFRYRGKANFNNDKSTPVVYGFEGIEGYNGAVEDGEATGKSDAIGFPRELSAYAKGKLRDYYGNYAMDYSETVEVEDSEGRKPGEDGYVTTTETHKFEDNIDVGGVQCWEFSTAGTSNVQYWLGGGVDAPNSFSDVINASFMAGTGSHGTPNKAYSLSCLGLFVPITLEAQDAGLNFNSLVWAFIEGEEPIHVTSPRPLWATAWESRYPDLDFSLTDFYSTSKATDILDYDGFKLNPIYLETIYNWINSFSGYDDADATTLLALRKRFLDEVDLYFDVRNLCGYYSMTEVMFACDQRVKNMMMSIWWLNRDVEVADGNEYNKVGSKTNEYGNMEGRRAFFIFYDNDTTFGVANDGTLQYSWDADWDYAVLNNIPGYGYNSTLWKMVRLCLIDKEQLLLSPGVYQTFHELNNWNAGTYEYSVAAAYNIIRQICADGKVDGATALTSSCQEILKCYTDLTSKFSEQLFNKDVFYKYFKKTNRYGSCSGSRKEHKEWWVDNRMKYLDAKYGTGIINTSSLTFYALILNGATISVKGKTARNKSKFYVTSSGSIVGNVVEFTETPSTDYLTLVDNVQFGIQNVSSISGFYWLEDLDIKVTTNPQSNGSGYITSFGSGKDQMKYLKHLRTEGLSKLFNGNETYERIVGNDSGASGKTQLPLNYLPSIETLECVNETPRDILDLSVCTKILKLSLNNAFVKHIIFPSGSNISSKWDEGNNTGVLLATTTLINALTSQVEKTTLILLGLDNFRLDDIKVDTGGTWKSAVNGLYIDNCKQLQVDDILNAITNSQGEINISNFYLTIKGWEGSGGWDVLDKFIYQSGSNKGKVKVGAVVYTPATGSNTASVELKSDICGISGDFYLNIWPKEKDLAKYERLFPNLTIHYPEYSYIILNEKEDNLAIAESGYVYNPSNQTGYGTSLEYVPDGHIIKILNKRHRVLGKVVSLYLTEGVTICLLDDSDSNKYYTGQEANLDGSEGDVWVIEPHYWYKGVNDVLNGKAYAFYATNPTSSDPLVTSNVPESKGKTVKITYTLIYNNSEAAYNRVDVFTSKAILNATNGANISLFLTSSNVKSYVYKLKLRSDNDLAIWSWVRFPASASSYYGAVFTDIDDNVITDSNGNNIFMAYPNWKGSSLGHPTYYIAKIPERAVYLYTTVGFITTASNFLDSELEDTLSTEPLGYNYAVSPFILSKPASETFPYIDLEDWVEHKPYLCGAYKASLYTNGLQALRSISGVLAKSSMNDPSTVESLAFNSSCLANTSDGNGFLPIDYEMYKDIANLFIAKYGHRNSQYILGSTDLKDTSAKVTGATNSLGMKDTMSLARAKSLRNLGNSYDSGVTYIPENLGCYVDVNVSSDGVVLLSTNTYVINCLGYESWIGNGSSILYNFKYDDTSKGVFRFKVTNYNLSTHQYTYRYIPAPALASWSNLAVWVGSIYFGKYMDIIVSETNGGSAIGYTDVQECYRGTLITPNVCNSWEAYLKGPTGLGVFALGSLDNIGGLGWFNDTVYARLGFRGKITWDNDVLHFKNLILAGQPTYNI